MGSGGSGVGTSAQRATPHLHAGAQAIAGKALSNVAATVAVVSFGLFLAFTGMAISHESLTWAQAAAFALYGAIFFGILHAWGFQTFADNAKYYWLAVSAVSTLHALAFGYANSVVWAFAASAALALLVVCFGIQACIKGATTAITAIAGFTVRLFSGKYGRSTACLAWTLVLAGVGLYFARSPGRVNATLPINGVHVSIAYAALLGAVLMAMATLVLFTKDNLVSK